MRFKDKKRTDKRRFVKAGVIICSFMGIGINANAQYTPIAIADGFNADVIANGEGTSMATTNNDVDGVNYVYFSNGWQLQGGQPSTTGLPETGLINSALTTGLTFQLADYSSNNSLRLPGGENGTLALATPMPAQTLYVLAFSGSGSSTMDVTLNFSDETEQTASGINVADWYGGTGIAITGFQRVNRTNNIKDNSFNGPNIYQYTIEIPVSNQSKIIESVSFHQVSGGGILNVFGISAEGLLPECSGQPTAGTIGGNATEGVCGATSFMLSVTGSTQASEMSYVWQKREPNGTNIWEDIAGVESTTLAVVSGISEATDYRFYVVCNTSELADTSNVVSRTINAAADCICIPVYTSGCSSGDRINSFSLIGDNGSSIENMNSGCSTGGYGDYTDLDPVDLTPGQTYIGTVETDYGSPDFEAVRIWIDYNDNGVFEADETIGAIDNLQAGGSEFEFITLGSALEGLHRMRVRLVYNTTGLAIDPCSSVTYGETEDYMVNVLAAPSCISVSHVHANFISSTDIQLGWTEYNDATSWSIEYGPQGMDLGDGTLIEGVSTNPYTLEDLEPNTFYDIYVRSECEEEDLSSWSGPKTFWTKCVEVNVPFIETFEDDSETVNCWENEYVQGTGDWTIGSGSNTGAIQSAFEGEKNAVFIGNGSNNITKFVTPLLDVTGQDSLGLVFAYGQQYYIGTNATKIYAQTENDSIWIELASYIQEAASWKLDTLVIQRTENVLSGNLLRIAFEGVDNWGSANVIDDVQVIPCVIEPGIDGSIDVCRADGVIDLNTAITQGETWGRWSFSANPEIVEGSLLNVETMASGTYEFLYIVESVCGASDTTVATVNVYGPSSAGIDGTITVCKNQPINLYFALSGTVDMGGDWYDFDGNLLPNSHPTAPSLAANYNYNYIVSNGVCSSDTALVEVIVDGSCDWLSIVEEAFDEISVYPNPATNIINIQNPSNILSLSVELIDLNGRTVYNDNNALNNAASAPIDISQLGSGVYVLRLYNAEGQKTFKVVKQ